jgi:hypothetical protein
MHLAGGIVATPPYKDVRFEDVMLETATVDGKLIKKSFRFQR